LSPSRLRNRPQPTLASPAPDLPGDWIRLTLGYRAPLAWEALVQRIALDTPPGVGSIEGTRYGRTVALEGCRGVIFVAAEPAVSHVNVDLSVSLLPGLMPLLARLRHLLDLDAEPAVIDAHLEQEGLAGLVAQRPGLRLPGAFDGFEVAARELLGSDLLGRVTEELGEPFDTGMGWLDRLGLTPYRVAEAGRFMTHLGVPTRRAEALALLAQAMADAVLRLEPGSEVPATLEALSRIPGVDARSAMAIVMRALHWPDAFWAADPELQRAAGVRSTQALQRMAERWRPWRAYAAAQLAYGRRG
jgi:AraC family transcriptional regulator, regulatory protein of adaptative response / DNA-3-methyladenine glycosylase II